MYPSPYPSGPDAESPMTPQEAREASFSSVRLGRRGVDEGEVRAFCERVAEELARSLTQRTALESEVRRLRERVLGREGGGPTTQDAHVQAVNVLTMAQRTADQYVADAQEYSRELAEDAHLRHDEILREAQVRASVILDESHAAAQAAADLVQPAGDAPVESGQRETDAELAYLRTFSQVCRTHLRAYLDSLTKSIEEWEKVEEQGLAAARGATTRTPTDHTPPGRTPPDRMPPDRMPTDRAPADRGGSGRTGSAHTGPDYSGSGYSGPDGTSSDYAAPDHAESGHAEPGHTGPGHTGPNRPPARTSHSAITSR
jgi:cell division septum initiation protein DivIVA